MLNRLRGAYKSLLKPFRSPSFEDGDLLGKAYLWHANSVSRNQVVHLDVFWGVSAAENLQHVHRCTPSKRCYSSERETRTAPEQETLRQHRLYLYQRGKVSEAPLKDQQEVRRHIIRTPRQEGEAELRFYE